MIFIFAIIVVVVAIIIYNHIYKIRPDAMTVITGTLGSGKSLIGTELALKLLRKQRRKVWFYNLLPWHARKKRPKPLMYSSIPFRVKRKEWAQVLTVEQILCREKIVPRSVVFWDEIALFCDQMQALKNPNIGNGYTEFATLFRHYTKGGYVVATTQNSSKIPYAMRYSAGAVLNCQHCRTFFGLFYMVSIRNISISEDIKAVEQETAEESMKVKFGILPVFSKRYDSYCFSERYAPVPDDNTTKYQQYKINSYAKIPKELQAPLTTDKEKEEG